MNLIEKIKGMFSRKAPAEAPEQPTQAPEKIKRTCKECGKTFTVDPSAQYIPNYCKECKQRFAREKEERQRAGNPQKIKRKCKNCGKFFTFPSTLPHYPNYCNNCRKAHQVQMKAKYGSAAKRKSQRDDAGK